MIFEREIYLGLSSVDRAGVIFYPQLFRHAHDLYESFMASVGQDLDRVFKQQIYLIPIVHAEADYRLPMRHGETFQARLRVMRLGQTSFTLGCDFVNSEDKLCAHVQTVHTFVDRSSMSSVPMPDEFRGHLKRFSV